MGACIGTELDLTEAYATGLLPHSVTYSDTVLDFGFPADPALADPAGRHSDAGGACPTWRVVGSGLRGVILPQGLPTHHGVGTVGVREGVHGHARVCLTCAFSVPQTSMRSS